MILAILVLPCVWFILHLILRSPSLVEPFVISHRGAAAFAPENTLAGVSEAVNQGAEFVEVDVQRSADGVLVIMHDRTVDRTTDGTGEIQGLSWEELQSLDAGAHFSQKYAGEPIPTLDSVLGLVAGESITLVLEAKNPELYPGIEHEIADHLEKANLADQTVVVSFGHDWLERFHKVSPETPLGKLYVWMGSPGQASGVRLVDVHWLSVVLDPTLVRRAHQRGYQVVVWTVNNDALMRLLLWLGVDGITTDRPDLWSKVTS